MPSIAGASNITTGATSQVVLANRQGRRIAFSVSNYGATVAYLNLSDTSVAEVGKGIALYPGMTISDSNAEGYYCWQGSITAVDNGAGGATTLSMWERVK